MVLNNRSFISLLYLSIGRHRIIISTLLLRIQNIWCWFMKLLIINWSCIHSLIAQLVGIGGSWSWKRLCLCSRVMCCCVLMRWIMCILWIRKAHIRRISRKSSRYGEMRIYIMVRFIACHHLRYKTSCAQLVRITHLSYGQWGEISVQSYSNPNQQALDH